ncbi:MAG: T9SS type A sorting domain-containing protein, partial [Bacteroidota bacterium]
ARFYFDNQNNIYQIPVGGNADWQGVKFSADGGITWEEIIGGLPQNLDEYTITGLAFDNNNVAYVSLSDGTIYKLEQTSDVQEEAFKNEISIAPNPATDNVTIAFKSDSPAKITVYSILGEVVYTATITDNARISTKEFAPGVYHFTISSGNTFKTGSIVKK